MARPASRQGGRPSGDRILVRHGPKDDRVLTITCIDKQGVTRWTHDIKAAELK